MAEMFGMEFRGEDKLKLSLALTQERTRKELEKAMFKEGVKVQARAQEIIRDVSWTTKGGIYRGKTFHPAGSPMTGHVDTGNLRRSIMTEAKADSQKVEVRVGTNVFYAPFVEALPDGGFLFPALLEKREEILKGIQEAVKRAIDDTSRNT